MRNIKIYQIRPAGYKLTNIQVKEINHNEFICKFLDVNVINEFKTIGFKALYKDGLYSFKLNGNMTFEYAQKVWDEYLDKINNPDIEFTINDLS